jgi:alpha-mannosidase
LNSHIKINDSSKVISVIVDRARGGTVIKEGVIELMLHRRTIYDDVRGVW